jgi:hypothetical protein
MAERYIPDEPSPYKTCHVNTAPTCLVVSLPLASPHPRRARSSHPPGKPSPTSHLRQAISDKPSLFSPSPADADESAQLGSCHVIDRLLHIVRGDTVLLRLPYAVPVTSPATQFVSDYTGPSTSPHFGTLPTTLFRSAPVTAILTTLCIPTRNRLPECAQVDACPTHLRCALQDRLLNSAHVLRSRLLVSSRPMQYDPVLTTRRMVASRSPRR